MSLNESSDEESTSQEKWRNSQLGSKKKQTGGGKVVASFALPTHYLILLKDTTTRGVAPRLGVRPGQEAEAKQIDFGEQIVSKLQSKKYQRFKNFMPLGMLLK